MRWPQQRWIGQGLVVGGKLSCVLSCAALAAAALGSYLETRLDLPRAVAPLAVRADEPAAPQPRWAGAIVGRNLFCSSCEPPPVDEGEPAGAIGGPLDLNNLQLVATVVDLRGGGYAAIRERSSQAVGLFAVGDRLAGGLELLEVAPRQVTLRRDASRGVLPLQPERDGNLPAQAKRGMVGGGGLMDQLAGGVRKVAPGRFVIQRDLVHRLMARTGEVGRWARIVPRADRFGRAAGFVLRHVRPHSIYAVLGLRDGDAVSAVNGRPLTVQSALTLFTQLRSATHLAVSVERRGKTLTYDYTIQ